MRHYIKSYILLFFLFITAGLLSGQTGCDDLLINLGDDIAEAGATLRPYFEDVANVGGKRIKAWEIARRANLDEAISLSPDDLTKIDDYIVRTGKSADDVVEEIVGNSKATSSTSRSWVDVVSKGAGAKVGQLGNYSVHEGGEVIYRTISQSHYDDLLASGKLQGTGETTTAGVIGEAQGYNGITVKFYVKNGTINEFVANGRMAQSSHTLVTQQFGITQVAPSGWNTQFVRFKQENGLVNIQLGNGPGLNILNNNLIGFEKISVQ